MNKPKKIALIIGAGPAGLTAAYELLKKTEVMPVIIDSNKKAGGICRTIDFKGNKIDIGGHRFFSRHDQIVDWWLDILPLKNTEDSGGKNVSGQGMKVPNDLLSGLKESMLVRKRVSRIFFDNKFIDYPISFNFKTFSCLGIIKSFKIVFSLLKSKIFPPQHVRSIEDFFIKRFGKQLYKTFFKDYTEKVWGVSCSEISAEWGMQRIKNLSLSKIIKRFFKKPSVGLRQKEPIQLEYFMYPACGCGQIWEKVEEKCRQKGASFLYNHKVVEIFTENNRITSITAENLDTNKKFKIEGDYFLSSVPVKDLVDSFDMVPEKVNQIAEGLIYRDFIEVGILLKKIKLSDKTSKQKNDSFIKDTWIYIHDKDLKLGRLQVLNNWSPFLVKNKSNVLVGLEYFCSKSDKLWNMTDKEIIDFAVSEASSIGFIDEKDVLDGIVIKESNAYPAYFGTYKHFSVIKNFVDKYENLFLIGRNGMHRYNNMDHSMLTAIKAVDNIKNNSKRKDNIWEVF